MERIGEERWGIGRWRRHQKGDDSDVTMEFINTVGLFFSLLFCFLFFLNFPGFMPFLFLDSEPGQSDLTTCSACHGVVFNLHFENGWDNTSYKIYFHHVHLYHNYRHNIIINSIVILKSYLVLIYRS